jgi:NTE family protein
MSTLEKLFFVILILFFGFVSNAQNKRPKIGLVLSGGGAKGVAHLGILKAMEEAGLTPDYITGTSMGSIMGGLYSIGYSADEIKEIVNNADWDLLLSNKIPLDKVTFEEKAFYGRYLIDFYLKEKQLEFPSGVIEGQALMELFSEVTRSVHHITDFNKFPIPYACVGSNIVTGEPVVLNKGSLAQAMRASMAIPTVFTPVKIDGKLLVDGGLVRNMPVDEVLDMGADIVIGVFVGTNLNEEEDLKSLLSILTQSAFITSARDAEKQLAKCDILIKPNLEGFSTSSFHQTSEIIERGEEAGKAYLDVFKNLADSLKKIGPLHQVVKPVLQDTFVFDNIEIEGNNVITDDFIVGKLKFISGKKISLDELEKRIEFMFGTQYFTKVQFQILGEEGNRTLKITVVERPKTHFRFSYHYDSENKGGIISNVTLRNVLLKSSRLIFEADLSGQPGVLMDYFKYMGKKQNFALGASGIYWNKELPVYETDGTVNNIFSSTYYSGGFKLQSTNVQSSTYGVAIDWSNMTLKVKLTEDLPDELEKIKYWHTKYTAFYRFNNLNDLYFPTKGISSNIEFSVTSKTGGRIYFEDIDIEADEGDLIQTSNIKTLKFDILPLIPVSKKLTIVPKGRLRLSTIQADGLNLTEYDFVGGFTPDLINASEYYGSDKKEYVVGNYFYGRLGLQYELARNLYFHPFFNFLSTEFPVTIIYPDADIGTLGDRKTRYGYGAKIGLSSPVGPVALAVAKDHFRSGWKASLIIGFHY